ncbi:unnamed protein product [Allacma fusca]|uniref:protein-tyrosine-phosphatase n=1 Tax=Allacma fusca TaxID=39272 RepID=A0A8J2NWV2_9HEXA|nr:unnamed protein product [Allacma fusca]
MVFQDVGLQVSLISERKSRHFIIRTLSIEELSTRNIREVLQFHYVTWPDFGVPSTPKAFLHFLQEVRDSGALNSKVGPPVVHCSAGIGRSGTFCLVDSCLLMMETGQEVNVKDILLEMRKFRMGLIQTSDQLRFSYMAILEGAQQMANGNTRFAPDDTTPELIIDDEDRPKPVPPPRITSLPPPASDKDFEKYLKRHVRDMAIIAERPLPELPLSSADETSDSDVIDEDESDSGDEIELLEERLTVSGTTNNDSDEDYVSGILDSTEKDTNNGRVKTNGVDEKVRKRTKNEITMDKIREIKKLQKESEKKAELYQRLYRSFTGKRFLFCLGFSMAVMYLYSKF